MSPSSMDDQAVFSLTRRLLLGGMTTLPFATSSVRSAMPASSEPHTPLDQLRLLLKMMASTVEAAVPWFYTGRIYAVRTATAPLHLFNFEGSEIYWMKQTAADTWSMSVSTLTFYRDRISGDYLDQFENPLTGKTVSVSANVLRSKPAQPAVYRPLSFSSMGENQDITLEIHRSAELLWLTTSRANARGVQPAMEVNTLFCAAAEADDRHRTSARSTFSSVSLSHWSKWLEMGDQEGHLLWHAAGRKLNSLGELPPTYRSRADALKTAHFDNPDLDVAS